MILSLILHILTLPTLIGTSLLDLLRWLLEAPVAVLHGYSWLLRSAAEGIQSLFERYGYWVIFLGTFCENTLFVGLVVPGVLVVILAGLAAENGTISPLPAIALGVLGTVLGDTVSYFLGRFGWSRLGADSSFRGFTEKVREPILRRGALFVMIYHFTGYTRVVGPAAAGMLLMPYRRWAPADHIGALLWVTTYLAIGYGLGLLGLDLDATGGWFRALEWGLLALVAIWGYFFFRTMQRTFMTEQPDVDAASLRTND